MCFVRKAIYNIRLSAACWRPARGCITGLYSAFVSSILGGYVANKDDERDAIREHA
jgi:hypothetical protein